MPADLDTCLRVFACFVGAPEVGQFTIGLPRFLTKLIHIDWRCRDEDNSRVVGLNARVRDDGSEILLEGLQRDMLFAE